MQASTPNQGEFVSTPFTENEDVHGVVSLNLLTNLFLSMNAKCECGGTFNVTDSIGGWTGGELCFRVSCTQCNKKFVCGNGARSLRDRQDPTSAEVSVGKKMLYNYIISGGHSYKNYQCWMSRTGMTPYSSNTYDRALAHVLCAAEEVLQEEMNRTKVWMEGKNEWKNGVLGLDGSWNTPGASAPHGLFAARAIRAYGALLGFKVMSRNDPANPFLGTSASMEVFGCVHVLNYLREQGFGVTELKAVTDGDTSAGKMIPHLWERSVLLACSGHMNKNLGKAVLIHSGKKGGLKGIKSFCVCRKTNHRYTTCQPVAKRRHHCPPVDIDTTTLPDEDSVRRFTVKVIKAHLKACGLPLNGLYVCVMCDILFLISTQYMM